MKSESGFSLAMASQPFRYEILNMKIHVILFLRE